MDVIIPVCGAWKLHDTVSPSGKSPVYTPTVMQPKVPVLEAEPVAAKLLGKRVSFAKHVSSIIEIKRQMATVFLLISSFLRCVKTLLQ